MCQKWLGLICNLRYSVQLYSIKRRTTKPLFWFSWLGFGVRLLTPSCFCRKFSERVAIWHLQANLIKSIIRADVACMSLVNEVSGHVPCSVDSVNPGSLCLLPLRDLYIGQQSPYDLAWIWWRQCLCVSKHSKKFILRDWNPKTSIIHYTKPLLQVLERLRCRVILCSC